MRRRILLLVAASFLPALSSAQGADYEIRLTRPGKAGDRYRIEATGEQLRQVALRSGGQTIPGSSEGFKVELTGDATVLEADAKGSVTRAQVRIGTLVRVLGLRRDEMLDAGTVVTESRSGARQVFQIGGREVTPVVKDLLEVVLSETSDPDVPNDDELLGTRERKKVGESWQVNRDSLARFVSRDRDISLDVKPGDVEGSGRFTALERVDDVQCQRIDISFTFLGTPRVDPPPPPGASARVTVTMSNLLPVDTKLDARAQTSQLTMTYTMDAMPRPDRPAEQMVATWSQKIDRKLRPLR
jgi:hypothetical protein